MHAFAGRVHYYDVGLPVALDEFWSENPAHVARFKRCVGDAVAFRVPERGIYGLTDAFDAHDFAGDLGHEEGNGSGAGVKVVDRLATLQPCGAKCLRIKAVGLLRIGLVELLGADQKLECAATFEGGFHGLLKGLNPVKEVKVDVVHGIVDLLVEAPVQAD